MSKKKEERRKHPRLDVEIWAVEKDENSRSFHLVTNLSMGGLFLEKKLPFKAGANVNLELEIEGERVSLRGKIVNNYNNSITNRTGAGVRFVDMDAKTKTKIGNYLKNLKKD